MMSGSTENRTVLLPTAQSQNSLTDFSPSGPSDSSHQKNVQTARPQEPRFNSQRSEVHYVGGRNPFIALASPIFKQIDMLQHTYDVGSVDKVHNQLVEELNRFMQNADGQNVENSEVLVARYLLCTFMDELICTTYWGKDSNWSSNSLLSFFYHETYGGEKFFQLLHKLLASPANHIHLLELMYVCISLGFEGKYRIQPSGKMELDAIRDNLYKQIKTVQGRQSQKFYTKPAPSAQQHRLFYKASYPILIVSIATMLTIIYSVLTFSLTQREDGFMQIMQHKSEKFRARGSMQAQQKNTTEAALLKDDNE